MVFDVVAKKLVEGQTRSQHQQVVAQLDPALAVVPREHGLLLVGRALEYPPRRFLRHRQAVEGGVIPSPGAQRLARGPDLAKFTGLQKRSELAEDVDAGQGGLDRGDPLPLGSATSILHARAAESHFTPSSPFRFELSTAIVRSGTLARAGSAGSAEKKVRKRREEGLREELGALLVVEYGSGIRCGIEECFLLPSDSVGTKCDGPHLSPLADGSSRRKQNVSFVWGKPGQLLPGLSSWSLSKFGAAGSGKGTAGSVNVARRETLLEYLNDGTLTLEVHLGINKQSESTSFVPSNPIHDNILKGFNNEEKSDVKFVVSGEAESAPNRRKRAKNTPTTFHASHAIPDLVAPALADMCKPGDKAAAVPIKGVEPEVFRMLLYFCYGGTVSDDELGANAKPIIESADRFGIVNLKLKAEAVLTEQTEITVNNMLDNLLYANSKNLALFQEMIMDFVAENGDKIIGNVSFSNVPGELMSDLLTATTRGIMSTGKAASEDDLKFTRVGELRRRLHDKGLCIDGSRETMIALLKENTEHNNGNES
ncbi:hypothetical protein THAOC_27194 [Thalassiosira oceanica]|uniref:BTB domain-containing protein n=1 Tax=Thalassiosira oceanica TaxID=159749 RepID=K0RWZ8_THAOC|nr:hypothetical protein THAOC_27194 [Thalassiosira oceanica]|eukprot:EJK53386.1 hypothetical protein THAOC_27194 [Thalassiosira oceanica]